MGYFPISLELEGRQALVIGGGRVADRKVRALLSCDARVRVISPALTPSLAELARQGRISHLARGYREGDLAGAFLVIAATDDATVQQQVHAEAEKRGQLINVADVPSLCNFILPATVRRGAFTVAVSTGGSSPALASRLRQRLETEFGPEYQLLTELLGKLRLEVIGSGRPARENKTLFQALVKADLAGWIRAGDWPRLRQHVRATLGSEAAARLVDDLAEQVAPGQQQPGESP